MNVKVDLHLHSNWSDGSIGIPELIRLAKNLELKVISITDHDTMAGQYEAIEEGKKQGMWIIPGVEISAYNPATGRKAHILGFNVKDPEGLNQSCRPFLEARHQKNLESVNRIIDAGYPININDIHKYTALDGIVYRQHIMHAMVDRGYATSIYGDLYNKFFGKFGLAKVKATYMEAEEAVRLIIDCGGLAVLAHPFQYDSMDMVPRLKKIGLAGIEYRHHTQTFVQEKAVLEASLRYNLFLAGGSDFHGFYSEKCLQPGCTDTVLPKSHPLINNL